MEANEPKKKFTGWIILGVVILLIGGGYWWWSSSHNGDEAVTPTEDSTGTTPVQPGPVVVTPGPGPVTPGPVVIPTPILLADSSQQIPAGRLQAEFDEVNFNGNYLFAKKPSLTIPVKQLVLVTPTTQGNLLVQVDEGKGKVKNYLVPKQKLKLTI